MSNYLENYFNDVLLINSMIVPDEYLNEIGPCDGPTDLGPIVIGTYQQFRDNFVQIYQYWHQRYMNNLFEDEIDDPMSYEQCRDHYLSSIIREATEEEVFQFPHLIDNQSQIN